MGVDFVRVDFVGGHPTIIRCVKWLVLVMLDLFELMGNTESTFEMPVHQYPGQLCGAYGSREHCKFQVYSLGALSPSYS